MEQPFFNTGLYNLDGAGAYPAGNRGLLELTNDPIDMGKFRPPTLRNIALTAPYMHDGSVAALEDVIDIYARAGRKIAGGPLAGDGAQNPHKSGLIPGFVITAAQKDDLDCVFARAHGRAFRQRPAICRSFCHALTGQHIQHAAITGRSASNPNMPALCAVFPGGPLFRSSC